MTKTNNETTPRKLQLRREILRQLTPTTRARLGTLITSGGGGCECGTLF